jgi:hypothetical protein
MVRINCKFLASPHLSNTNPFESCGPSRKTSCSHGIQASAGGFGSGLEISIASMEGMPGSGACGMGELVSERPRRTSQPSHQPMCGDWLAVGLPLELLYEFLGIEWKSLIGLTKRKLPHREGCGEVEYGIGKFVVVQPWGE